MCPRRRPRLSGARLAHGLVERRFAICNLHFWGPVYLAWGIISKNCVLLSYDMMGIEWGNPIRTQSHFSTTRIVPNRLFIFFPLHLFAALVDLSHL